MSPAEDIIAFVVTPALLGALLAWFIIRTLRRKSFTRWPFPLRWAFLALTAYLVVLGGFLLLYTYAQRIGLLPQFE